MLATRARMAVESIGGQGAVAEYHLSLFDPEHGESDDYIINHELRRLREAVRLFTGR